MDVAMALVYLLGASDPIVVLISECIPCLKNRQHLNSAT